MLESESNCTNWLRTILNVSFTFIFLLRAFSEDIVRTDNIITKWINDGTDTKWAHEMYERSTFQKLVDFTLYF